MDRLKSYGLEDIYEEAGGPFGRSWSVESYTIDMMTPRYSHLDAVPLAWSGPTKGAITGDVMLAPLPSRELNPKKLATLIQDFETEWKGKLQDEIVLITTPTTLNPKPNQTLTVQSK